MSECLNCKTQIKSNNRKYCSVKCQRRYQARQIIDEWKQNADSSIRSGYRIRAPIRDYLFEKHKNACSKCGWKEVNPFTNNVPLEIHHIDGDCSNNAEDNLQVLCPNCHALSHNYKGANKKGAGSVRSKYHRTKHK